MGSKQTSTARSDPWGPTQAGLKQVIGDATSLYNNGGFRVTPFGGDWTVGRSQDSLDAASGLRGLVPGMASAAGTGLSTVLGMMGPQNYDQIKANTIADIMPGINASFAGSGMTGSGLHQQNLAKGLAAGLGNVELGARDQSLRAASMLPQALSTAMQPYQMLGQLGAQDEAFRQNALDAAMRKDIAGQTVDLGALQQYAQLMSGLGGQFGTQTNTQKQSMGLGGILGLGLQMAAL